jgi:GNAT superfamily N-acetyltransferase
VTVAVAAVDRGDQSALALFIEALDAARGQRGGDGLLRDLARVIDEGDPERQYETLVGAGALFACLEDGALVGVAATDPGGSTVVVVYVEPSRRRRSVATELLRTILAQPSPPRDAWALPGDRATKSLYEKAGWKARRLTMSAE